MTEHESTIEVIRSDYRETVTSWIGDNYDKYRDDDYDWRELIEKCTTLQLRALIKNIIENNSPAKLLRCNPSDHLAVELCSMYVGIETDGYTHS